MTDQHPITPPPELVQQWINKWGVPYKPDDLYQHLCTQAARWGANQELEACCELMDDWGLDEADLRAARRPKPPTLKEQALAKLAELESDEPGYKNDFEVLRRALEALPND